MDVKQLKLFKVEQVSQREYIKPEHRTVERDGFVVVISLLAWPCSQKAEDVNFIYQLKFYQQP